MPNLTSEIASIFRSSVPSRLSLEFNATKPHSLKLDSHSSNLGGHSGTVSYTSSASTQSIRGSHCFTGRGSSIIPGTSLPGSVSGAFVNEHARDFRRSLIGSSFLNSFSLRHFASRRSFSDTQDTHELPPLMPTRYDVVQPTGLARVVERLLKYHEGNYAPVSDRAAAVLVGLFADSNGVVRVLLNQRTAKLSTHGGEVCLPGGKREDRDRGDDVITALREAYEELGLDPRSCRVLAKLPPVLSKHLLSVTPVITLLPPNFRPVINPDEVATFFTMPLAAFLGEGSNMMTLRPEEGSPSIAAATPRPTPFFPPGLSPTPVPAYPICPLAASHALPNASRGNEGSGGGAGNNLPGVGDSTGSRIAGQSAKEKSNDENSPNGQGCSSLPSQLSTSSLSPSMCANSQPQQPAAMSPISAVEPSAAAAAFASAAKSAAACHGNKNPSLAYGKAAQHSVMSDPSNGPVIHSCRDMNLRGCIYRLHSFRYYGFDVWGLTAAILMETAKIAFATPSLRVETSEDQPALSRIRLAELYHDGDMVRQRAQAEVAAAAAMAAGKAAAAAVNRAMSRGSRVNAMKSSGKGKGGGGRGVVTAGNNSNNNKSGSVTSSNISGGGVTLQNVKSHL
mmetsp:Transcript_27144/g.50022  ORF Transcript_27144/g.50022 Transcript_27144/m.50022 type:complete len:621 (-) Transcript_27144:830-2692(-)|eukprot:CAMPEP_0175058412 /NCGR_PEP_ID=MMETSP0052_2-20121109/11832_1 /TAXON_ID=51329 ORGANISM="Polytomella parva, Strain SAG 63-3" /NCGR_SAMPLE_ID=MMETSP0052_2 /ASSEMBLY_ACC=CAM_ASM_000194 /LENGTH=620 /DNA_ID=CAMNT_0016323787 /DNA_START=286 /DNA_END=2148 /DNA_ORIENTATION=+